MKNPPLVSVVMPVYNGEPFVEEAILSILNQSYEDFELLIIDDGSWDSSLELITKYEKLDSRVHSISHTTNQGLVAALNSGLAQARGKYLARMDQDDISLKDRFIKQVQHLEARPEIGIAGCRVRHIDGSGNFLNTPRMHLDKLSIRWQILFHNPFYHSAVMLRKRELDQIGLRYDPNFENGEDYDLWSRLLMHTWGENLPDILLHYRFHAESMSERRLAEQHRNAADIASLTIHRHLPDVKITTSQAKEVSYAFSGITPEFKHQRARLINIYLNIWSAFESKHQGAAGLVTVKQEAFAWAARMVLYPPFQPRVMRALMSITTLEWRWPRYLLGRLPYYLIRKQD